MIGQEGREETVMVEAMTMERTGQEWREQWFLTFTGQKFYPHRPRAEDVRLEDIAHALARICRFNGHVREFYSVAQHSVHVSELVPPGLALIGLIHDAAEAYVGDMVRPLKVGMLNYCAVEARVHEAICEALEIDPSIPAEVKDADNRMLMTERRDLIVVQLDWGWSAPPREERITPWFPAAAEAAFLARYAQLRGAR